MGKKSIDKRRLVHHVFLDLILTEEETNWFVTHFDSFFEIIPESFQEVLRLMYTPTKGKTCSENTNTNIAGKVKNLITGKKGVSANTVSRRVNEGLRLLRKEYDLEAADFRQTLILTNVDWKNSFHALLSQSGTNKHNVRFLSQEEFDGDDTYRLFVLDWLNHAGHKQESLESDYFHIGICNGDICFISSLFPDSNGTLTGDCRVYGYTDEVEYPLYFEAYYKYMIGEQRSKERIRLNII